MNQQFPGLRLYRSKLVGAIVLSLGLLAGLTGPKSLWAQSNKSSKDNFQPVPYGEDEFPDFLHQVRRFEVIWIGTLPFTLLFGSLVYDIIYSASNPNIHTLTVAGSTEAIFQKVGISISISGLLAVIDMAIHLGKRHKQRKERERILRESEFIGRTAPAEPRAGPGETATEAAQD